jgi:hypothetical protein
MHDLPGAREPHLAELLATLRVSTSSSSRATNPGSRPRYTRRIVGIGVVEADTAEANEVSRDIVKATCGSLGAACQPPAPQAGPSIRSGYLAKQSLSVAAAPHSAPIGRRWR